MAPIRAEIAEDVREAISQIKSEIRSRLAQLPKASKGRPVLIRVEVPVDDFPLFRWICAQSKVEKVYWRDRDATFEAVGLGVADRVSAGGIDQCGTVFDHIQKRLASCELTARYYGGFRFDSNVNGGQYAEEWRPFGGAQFWLPLVEMYRNGGDMMVAGQIVVDSSRPLNPDALLEQFDQLSTLAKVPEAGRPEVIARTDNPDLGNWRDRVQQTLGLIKTGALEKLVLARRVSLRVDRMDEPMAFLMPHDHDSESATQFAFQIDNQRSFLGFSPELLYQRTGRNMYSEAIAGTRRRSGNFEEDRQFGNELMSSAKERREVDLVRDGIAETLGPFCRTLQVDSAPHLLSAVGVQHLRYAFRGILRDDVSDTDLLPAIAPTSAVCGSPREAAMDQIRALERFDRGWYAGPVGWVARDAATFAVGIRSALVHGNDIHLYSGAGIVAGSDPDAEWQELESKIKSYLSALGL
jgi:menaquinone-specific isochorismate synthase